MRNLWKALALSALFAMPALGQAQDGQPGEGRRPRRPQQDAGPGGPGGGRGGGILAMVDRIRSELNLDAQQTTQFDQIVAEYREKMQGQQQGGDDQRELMRQMREARQNGDDQKVQELRQQLRARGGGNMGQAFFDDVEKILRDDQKEKLGQLRQQMQRGRGMDPLARVGGLREKLNLDERQSTRWDRLYQQLEQAVAPKEGEPDPGQAMREARDGGGDRDPEKMREMREAMQQRRERNQQAIEHFLSQLEPVLNDQQKQTVAGFREELAQGPGGFGGGGGQRGQADPNNPRVLFQATQRLELTQEQRDQLRTIQQDAGKLTQEAGRDQQALADVKASVEKQIREILTPEQIKQFEAALARMEQRNRGEGGPRNAPGDDQPRARRRQPGDRP